jgi:PAS domain S-box-containing protein
MKSILIIDDEESVRKQIRKILEKRTYECSEASNAAEAKSLLKTRIFYLILCDIDMPGESGLDFVRWCSSEYPDIAVILVTGINSPIIAEEALSIGVYGYIIKPFKKNPVLIAVANALKRRGLEKERKKHIDNLDALVRNRTAELEKNVRELKNAKKELKKSEEKFRSIFENIQEAYFRVDIEGRLIMANPAAIKMLGYASFDEIRGINMKKFYVDPHQRDILLKKLKKEKSISGFETSLQRKDGSAISVLIGSHVLLNIKGEPWAVEGTMSDITERLSLEAQLGHSRKLEAVGQLAAGIAHEINTPIQYVGDNTRFLKQAFENLNQVFKQYEVLLESFKSEHGDNDLVQAVEAAVEEADLDYMKKEIPAAIEQTLEGVGRVAVIVRSMKEFSHPRIHEKTDANINTAIESTIIISRNEWKYVAEMETDLDASLPLVPCLPGEINQVLLNMIINGAHAIGDVVNNGSCEKGILRIKTCKIGDYAEITISDTGPGIPQKIQSRIFDPFFTTKEVGKGTGQGLAISHSVIVDKHLGELSFETEPGKGTTFTIRLPI